VTVDDLAGRTFWLESATVGGAPRELAGGGAAIELSFERDRLAAQPGCNGASGGYTLEDGHIVLSGPMQQTMMMCEDAALVEQDTWFVAFLEAKPLVTLDGDAITLTSADTELQGRDKEVASPDLPLEGTEWRIESRIDGGGPDGAVSSELWMEESTLVFEPGGRLQGSTACDGVLGTWTLDEATGAMAIALEPHGPCQSPDDPGKGEEQTFTALAGDDLTLAIDADQATLTHPDGSGVVLRAITG
jgi:heat shock protein HslJ